MFDLIVMLLLLLAAPIVVFTLAFTATPEVDDPEAVEDIAGLV